MRSQNTSRLEELKFLRGYFDLAANHYETDIEPAFAELAAGLVDFADLVPGTHIIDLGTGTGLVAQCASKVTSRIYALDFSMSMLHYANRRLPHNLMQANLHALPLKSNTFDLALASFALNSTDPGVSLKEAWRIIRPGGRLVIQEWGAPDPLSETVSDTLATYAVDDPEPELDALRAQMSQSVPWDDLETGDDIANIVTKTGFKIMRFEVSDPPVRLSSLDAYIRYKLAWPVRQAEVRAMSPEMRGLMMSDLRENLASQVDADGSLTWRPEIIRILAHKPPS